MWYGTVGRTNLRSRQLCCFLHCRFSAIDKVLIVLLTLSVEVAVRAMIAADCGVFAPWVNHIIAFCSSGVVTFGTNSFVFSFPLALVRLVHGWSGWFGLLCMYTLRRSSKYTSRFDPEWCVRCALSKDPEYLGQIFALKSKNHGIIIRCVCAGNMPRPVPDKVGSD